MISLDPLYLLLLVEAVVLASAAAIYLAVRRARCLDLLRQAAAALRARAPSHTAAGPAVVEAVPGAPSAHTPAAADRTGDDEALKTMVNRLQRIVDYQKTRILDLMTYIEVLEQAQERLSAIRQSSTAVRERFTTIVRTSRNPEQFGEVLNLFDTNTARLDEHLEHLREENRKLTETFRAWEEELKRMWEEESPETCPDFSAGDGALAVLRRENESLSRTVSSLEQRLAEESQKYDTLKKQMENLEEEYLVLYKRDQEHRRLE